MPLCFNMKKRHFNHRISSFKNFTNIDRSVVTKVLYYDQTGVTSSSLFIYNFIFIIFNNACKNMK